MTVLRLLLRSLNSLCRQQKNAFFFLTLLWFFQLNPLTALAAAPASPKMQPDIAAKAALVAEVNGKSRFNLLWQKEAYQRLPIASTTKILTALLVLKRAKLNDVVVVPRQAELVGGNKIGLKAGERRTVKELLYALLLNSANDAAVTFAFYLDGSEQQFARSMSSMAASLGAFSSNFINGHGLAPASQHYSTAYDLLLITKEALRLKVFQKIVATRKTVWFTADGERKVLENSNQLLTLFPYATGVKTGYTNESGYCLVASAKKEGRLFVAVVLGAVSREASFNAAEQLFNFAFSASKLKKVVSANKTYVYYPIKVKSIGLKVFQQRLKWLVKQVVNLF
jgi:D-alanyl-D-alanine carboxypeptidase (penicillin-binding protein 5/6)